MRTPTIILFLLVFASQISNAQNLNGGSASGSSSTTSSTFTDVTGGSASITASAGTKVLVVATFTGKTTTGAADAAYRIVDDESHVSGEVQRTQNGYYGIGSVVWIFTVTSTGTRSYTFQHKTSAGTLETAVSITAVGLNDGTYNLNCDVTSLASPVTLTGTWETALASNVVTTTAPGGFYAAASVQSANTDGTGTAVGEWVLQYKLTSGGTWRDMSFAVSRSASSNSKGVVSLLAALPNTTAAGSYYFRVAHRKTAGTDTYQTQACNLVAVGLGTGGGFFPVMNASKATASNSTTSFTDVLSTRVVPQSNTGLFLHAQFNMKADGTANSPAFDLYAKQGATEVYNGMDHSRYLSNNTDLGSGTSAGLMTGLTSGTAYDVSLRHASVTSRVVTTENTYLAGIGLNRSSLPLVPVTVNATHGLASSSYGTLKEAFDAVNLGTFRGEITILINNNTTETASAILYQSGYSSTNGLSDYSAITIYPTASGLSVTGNFSASLIDLNGADNVTIDGRVGATGTTRDLVFSNTNTGTFASAIRFINSAENNVVRYGILKSSCNSAGVGMVNFTSSAAGNGNDNNIVEYCNISAAGSNRPVNAIFSSGSTGRENSGNIIRNNNIFDFFNAGASSFGINISNSSTDWTITGNSFYETTSFVPAGAYKYYVLFVNTGNNNVISNNYIGGSEPLCGGTAWNINANTVHYFCGVYMNGGTAATLQGNTVANMSYTSVEDNPWDGFYINDGNVNVTGNTIGAATGTGSILITTPLASATATITGGVVTAINLNGGGSGYTTPPLISFSGNNGGSGAAATAILTGGSVTGFTITSGGSGFTSVPSVIFDGQSNNYSTSHGMIKQSSGTVNITGNTIGSVTTSAGSSTYSHGFESIYVRGVAGTLTISNNLVGSLTTANSIHVSSTASSSLQKQDVYGIYSAGIGTTIISGNTVANLTNAYAGTNTGSRARGIATITGSNTITGNTVRNISSASGQSGTKSAAAVTGIAQSSNTAGSTQSVSGNTVYDLTSTHATARVDVLGIYYSGPVAGTHSVSGNFVHSLSVSSSNIGCDIEGIQVYNGLTTISNNIVSLGTGITKGHFIEGIWDEGAATTNCNIYFNTVYIGGTVASGTTSSTAAFKNATNFSTRNYRNNILVNNRSGGTTGKHFAIILGGMTNVTIDYNDYLASGTGGMLGKIGAVEKSTLAAWQAGTGQDVNSLNTDPLFVSAGGTSAGDYYTSAVLPGVAGTGITTDYAGLTRGDTPKMGAYENNLYTWQGSASSNFGTAGNWTGGAVPPDGADIVFASNPANHCVLDQNRSLKNITNAQGDDDLVLNGHQLGISGNLTLSNGAQIDATAAASVVAFTGSAAQNMPAGAFVSSTLGGLTLNNANGLALSESLVVSTALTLSTGALAIGANTLTVNGAITATSGTLSGGSSSNLIMGGSGANTTLPAVSLNNLTLNRTNGITLSGPVTVAGTLALTAGTLTTGAHTLTLSGSSPTGTGNVDASAAGSELVFSNSAAISLPAAFFGASASNLTITGAGGVTAGAGFTVNGLLTLGAANPSATKGLLDLGSFVLTMGGSATTVGAGDVTGIITRTSPFYVNTPYTFGNEFTTINMADGGLLPSTMSVKVVLTSENLSWKTNAIHRYYDIIQTGGNSDTKVTLNLHYLESELNGCVEDNLDLFDYHITSNPAHLDDHGRSNANTNEKWVGLANMSLTYIAKGTVFDVKYWTLGTSEATNFTWLGAAGSGWNNTANWVGGVVPGSTNHVLIPDAATTPSDPELPATTTIGYMLIAPGGILNGGTGTALTIDGSASAWDNMGTFNAGTSTVIFTNAEATISDPTNFYNVTVVDGAKVTLGTNNVMRIAGTLSLSSTGVLHAANNHNTIEYNGGDQTVINPNGSTPGYHTLILSGSGTKTMPGTALAIAGDLSLSGTAAASAAAAITMAGNMTLGAGTSFSTGAYTHSLAGNFENDGTYTPTTGYGLTMNGISAQTIGGSTVTGFANLTVSNSAGLTLINNANINGELALTSGNLHVGSAVLGINGSLSRSSGYIDVDPQSSLSFGGTASILLPANLFLNTPSINNLTVNRTGGVTLGNQDMTVNGVLDLTSGTFTLAGNTLTIAGSSPARTSGFLDASNSAATLVFANADPVTLPGSFFTGNVNNLTLNGAGGLTATTDFAVNGTLFLQSVNPSSTKGILDMVDGSTLKTLTMGANAVTAGPGDVTGIVRRTSFAAGTSYSFGNTFTTITFTTGGTLPTEINAKIRIGSAPSWKTTAIYRLYDFIQAGGLNCYATIATHYLEEELNGNSENELVHFTNGTNGQQPAGVFEWGHSAFSYADNWVAIANVDIGYFPTAFGNLENTLSKSELASYTWNGSQSNSWGTIENWTPTGSPSTKSDITIPDGTTTLYAPVLSTSVEIKNLDIQSLAHLTIAGTGKLTVSGTCVNTPGVAGLVMNSGGSLIESSSGVFATVEREISAWNNPTANHGWHFLSAPVAGQAISIEFVPTPFGTSEDFYAWWEPTNEWVNFKSTSGTSWTTANVLGGTSGAGNFIPGKGYLVEYEATDTKTFTGELNTGDVPVSGLTISAGTNKGWHLLGNPYPSALTYGTDDWSLNHITGTAKIWSEANASYSDLASGIGVIPPLNGFMVQVEAGYTGNNSLVIPAEARVHTGTAWYKNTGNSFVRLLAKDLEGQTAQESVIRFTGGATTGYDPAFDSYFIAGYAPLFYAVAGNEHLSTIALPDIGGTVSVPFDFVKTDGSGYTIEAETISDIYGPVILKDLKTNETQDLTRYPVYSFTSSSGDSPSRFLVTFSHVGIDETNTPAPFTFYASGNTIFVAGAGLKQDGRLFVYNMMGQLMAEQQFQAGSQVKMSLNGSTGYYLVNVVTRDVTYTGKVFVNR